MVNGLPTFIGLQWGIENNVAYNSLRTITLPIAIQVAYICLSNVQRTLVAPSGVMSMYVNVTTNTFQLFKDKAGDNAAFITPVMWIAMGS